MVAAVKPFWVKFTEGLAELAIELLRNKLRRDRPGLFKENKDRDRPALSEAKNEIAPKQGKPGQKVTGPRRPRRSRKSRGRRRR